MELQKEWIEKALEDSVMLNPNNAPAQQTHMVAFAEGATEMLKAVEGMLKDNIAQVRKDLKDTKDKDVIIGLLGEEAALNVLINELQTIKPLKTIT